MDILIDAFARIADSRRELHLVVAGPDQVGLTTTLCARAEALGIGARVHFPGMLAGELKWGAYLGAEALTLPSHQENFGIVMAEALGCGLPVITTDKVNIWREINGAEAGLIGKNELEGFTRLLLTWIAMPQHRKAAMRIAAKTCHTEHFSIATAASALKNVLESIVTKA